MFSSNPNTDTKTHILLEFNAGLKIAPGQATEQISVSHFNFPTNIPSP